MLRKRDVALAALKAPAQEHLTPEQAAEIVARMAINKDQNEELSEILMNTESRYAAMTDRPDQVLSTSAVANPRATSERMRDAMREQLQSLYKSIEAARGEEQYAIEYRIDLELTAASVEDALSRLESTGPAAPKVAKGA